MSGCLRMSARQMRKMNLRQSWRRTHTKYQRGLCAICHERMLDNPNHPDGVSLDHIVPRARGGADTFENTQAVHNRCNQAKGADIAA